MLVPAMLHKEAILNGLKKRIYEDEMLYYSGWNGYRLPKFPMNLTVTITDMLFLMGIM